LVGIGCVEPHQLFVKPHQITYIIPLQAAITPSPSLIGGHNPLDITPLGQNPLPVARPDETPRTYPLSVELEHNVYGVVFCYRKGGSES